MEAIKWKRVEPGRHHSTGYAIERMHDGLWHVFDRKTSAEVSLRGMRTLRVAKAVAADVQASRTSDDTRSTP